MGQTKGPGFDPKLRCLNFSASPSRCQCFLSFAGVLWMVYLEEKRVSYHATLGLNLLCHVSTEPIMNDRCRKKTESAGFASLTKTAKTKEKNRLRLWLQTNSYRWRSPTKKLLFSRAKPSRRKGISTIYTSVLL